MLEHAFTMASDEYCGHCGSFDLVKSNPSAVKVSLFRAKPTRYCFGCNSQLSEDSFAMNATRTVPITMDDFFFQTNLNNQRMQRSQIQPLAHALGVSLIVMAITCLFLFKAPIEVHQLASNSSLEWVSASKNPTETYEMRMVKSLQLEFKQLEKGEISHKLSSSAHTN